LNLKEPLGAIAQFLDNRKENREIETYFRMEHKNNLTIFVPNRKYQQLFFISFVKKHFFSHPNYPLFSTNI